MNPDETRPLPPAAWVARHAVWLALLAGLLLPLAFAPFGVWPLAIISVAALPVLWRQFAPRRAARIGFAWGFGAFLAGLYWLYISLHIFGKAPLWLSVPLMLGVVAIMALYPALAGYLYARLGDGGRFSMLVTFPALWIALEWLRGWLASGFPWLALGYSQTDTVLAGLAPVGGVYLVSFAVVFSAGVLATLITGRPRVLVVAGLLGLWVVAAVLRPLPWTAEQPHELKVALLQGAVPQDQKWLPEQLLPTLRLYQKMTTENFDRDLVVWPEAAIPALLGQAGEYLGALWQAARASDTALLIGVPRRDQESGEFFNSVVALGASRQIYDKRHLVPFGEYFPVPGFVRQWLRLMNLPYTDFEAGATDQPPLAVAGEYLAVTICYEDLFGAEQLPGLARTSMLVNVSNDAWFGDSIAPHQHLQIARMRALETRRPMLRATNTGISAIIAANGTVLQRSQQFETMSLRGEVRGRKGKTPYMVFGDWLAVSLATAGLLLTGWRRGRQPV